MCRSYHPLGYFDFFVLMKNCEMLLTDSGGLHSTDRPEAVEAGFAKVVGVKKEKVLSAMERTLSEKRQVFTALPVWGMETLGKR